jgi:hypothetical protein
MLTVVLHAHSLTCFGKHSQPTASAWNMLKEPVRHTRNQPDWVFGAGIQCGNVARNLLSLSLKPAPLKTRRLTLGVADPFGVTAQGALPVLRKLCKLPWCPRARMLNTQTGHAPVCSSRAINVGRSWHTGHLYLDPPAPLSLLNFRNFSQEFLCAIVPDPPSSASRRFFAARHPLPWFSGDTDYGVGDIGSTASRMPRELS